MDIVSQFKKGWYTSEFWVTLVAIAAPFIALVSGYEVDVEGATTFIGMVVTAVGYAGSRTWLKRARVAALAPPMVLYPPDADDTLVTGLPGGELAP